MRIPDPSCLSRAELAKGICTKDTFAPFPAVQEQIKNFKAAKQEQANRDPEGDYLTITMKDLVNAVRTCVVMHFRETVDALRWEVVIIGKARNGLKLRLDVRLNKKDDGSPLEIMSFDPVREETEIEELAKQEIGGH